MIMEIIYSSSAKPTAEQIIKLYYNAGLPRPTADKERIQKMYDGSNLIITAWDGDILVGVSRCITDWVWSCYLADLAVKKEYGRSGIGKKLIECTQKELGEQVSIILLSVPTAMEYYPKVGFERQNSCFIITRGK